MTNIDKLEKIFPECITETEDANGNLIRAVDFEHLKQILSDELLEGREAYVFNFVGKKRAEFEAHKKIKATLRPIISESRDFDTTKNLYIEGDNLDTLKILQESYLSKVKMIYIDPPYNTGNDFIYRDDYKQDADDFDAAAQVIDDDGNRILNRESRGRFHSDWCAMIYSRLLIAKNFLSNDGVIFISIDDHEQANLKKICDEVFGEKNFVAQFTWRRRSGANDALNNVSLDHEYLTCYAKDVTNFTLNGVEKDFANYSNPDNDPRGAWTRGDLTCGKTAAQRPNLFYPITDPKTGITYECNPNRVWSFEKERMDELIAADKVIFPTNGDGRPSYKRHKREVRSATKPFSSIIETQLNTTATRELREILGTQAFDYPKTVNLIQQLINQATAKDSIVMDFFSGSATTAHAVMELNAQDGGNRQFIMIQIPEQTPDKSEARRAGFNTICEIGKERIRRAGDKLKEKYHALDVGFRVFKVDSSNFKDLPKVWTPQTIMDFVENIKDDRDEWDLLFGTLIDTGKTIDLSVTSEELDGIKVLKCAGGEILASFDKNIPAEVFRKLARREPQKIFFRDASFASSADKINALEFFRNFAPNTEVKVL